MSNSISKSVRNRMQFGTNFSANDRVILIGLIIFVIFYGIALAYLAVNFSFLFALIALLGIPAGVIFFRYPEVGLILNVIFIPFENINALALSSISIFELFTLVTYSAAVAHYLVFRRQESLVKNKTNWFLFFFLLFVVLSNLVAIDHTRSIDGTLRLLRNISLYLFAINLIRSKKTFYPLLWGLIFSGTLSALYGLYGYFFNHSLLDPMSMVLRVRGTMDDPNEFAGAMVVRTMIAVGFLGVVTKKYQRVLLVSSILILVYSVLLSGSRGGILGLSVAFLAYILTRNDKSKGVWLVIFSVIFIVGLTIMPLSLKQRIGLVETGANVGNNLDRRVTYLLLGQELIKENPLLGIGLDGFATAYAQSEYRFLSTSSGRIAHNTYLEIATGTGILGLSLFLILLGYPYLKSWKISRVKNTPELAKISAGLFAALSGFFVVAFFLSQQYEKTLWLLIGLAVIIEQLYLKESSLSTTEA